MKKSGGFTLIEVLLSFTLLGIISVFAVGGMNRSAAGGKGIREREMALIFAESLLDRYYIEGSLPDGSFENKAYKFRWERVEKPVVRGDNGGRSGKVRLYWGKKEKSIEFGYDGTGEKEE